MAKHTQRLSDQPAEPWVQERISARICEQVADVHVPQVLERTIEVPKIPNLQGTVEQILDVLVPEMVKQLAKLPNTVDAPVPQVVEELAEASRFSLRTGFNDVSNGRSSKEDH